MAFDDRLWYFLLGSLVGGVLGYIVRSLRDIKEEEDEILKRLDKNHTADEGGFIHPTVANVALVLVVLLTVWAAFASQKASNDVQNANEGLHEAQVQLEKTQVQLAHQTQCNRTVLRGALIALNERTTYSTAQVDSNIALQTSFAKLLGILLHQPPYSDKRRDAATNSYFQDLTNFVSIADKTKRKQQENPFPETTELDSCLNQAN